MLAARFLPPSLEANAPVTRKEEGEAATEEEKPRSPRQGDVPSLSLVLGMAFGRLFSAGPRQRPGMRSATIYLLTTPVSSMYST